MSDRKRNRNYDYLKTYSNYSENLNNLSNYSNSNYSKDLQNANDSRNNAYSNRAYYSNTSEAFELETLPIYEPGRRVRKKVKHRKTNKNIMFKYVGKTGSHISFLSAVTIIMVFIYAMGIVASFAVVFNKQNNIDVLQTELKTLQEANIATMGAISSNYNLEEIESIAVNKLGMGPPQTHQIIHITVPKESYAIQYDTNVIEEEETGIFTRFKNLFASDGE